MADLSEHPRPVLASSVWGFSIPWNLLAITGLGVWLLAAPAVVGVDIGSGAADVAHIGGAFVIVVAVVAMAEVVRVVRYANLAAAAVIAATLFLTGPDTGYATAILITAAVTAALSLPRGPVRDRYGAWDRLIR
jgi:hypothetical protein